MTRARSGRLILGVLAPLALAGVTACQSGDPDSSAPSATVTASGPPTSSAASPSPSTTSSAAASPIPITPERAPSSFDGTQADFLALTRTTLTQVGETAPASPARMAEVGRDLCAVLSGGGELQRKVDYWAGQHDLAGNDWASVFFGALRTYCPAYFDGYVQARTNPPPATPAGDADLVRFIVRRALLVDNQGRGPLDDVSDAQLARAGARLCTSVKEEVATGGTPDVPRSRELLATQLGLLEVYCSEAAQSALTAAAEAAEAAAS